MSWKKTGWLLDQKHNTHIYLKRLKICRKTSGTPTSMEPQKWKIKMLMIEMIIPLSLARWTRVPATTRLWWWSRTSLNILHHLQIARPHHQGRKMRLRRIKKKSLAKWVNSTAIILTLPTWSKLLVEAQISHNSAASRKEPIPTTRLSKL